MIHWNVDGEKDLSDAWTGFTRVILLNGRPPDGFSWSGVDRIQKIYNIDVETTKWRKRGPGRD